MQLKTALLVAFLVVPVTGAALAQDVTVPQVTTADIGAYANPIDAESRRLEESRYEAARTPGARPAPLTPKARQHDAGLRARMKLLGPEYSRRARTDGQASADRWLARKAREMGRRDARAKRHSDLAR